MTKDLALITTMENPTVLNSRDFILAIREELELETRDSEIDEEMSKPEVATNVAECVKLSKEKAEIAAELEELYEKWEELAE